MYHENIERRFLLPVDSHLSLYSAAAISHYEDTDRLTFVPRKFRGSYTLPSDGITSYLPRKTRRLAQQLQRWPLQTRLSANKPQHRPACLHSKPCPKQNMSSLLCFDNVLWWSPLQQWSSARYTSGPGPY